jgi:choline kinase
MERTNVVVLAAGKGSRLRGIGEERQKWLLEVAGETIAERQLAAIERAAPRLPGGAGPVRVVTGHAATGIERFLRGRGDAVEVELVPNSDYARRNNWWSLLVALRGLPEGEAGRVVVFNSDLCARPGWFEAFLLAAATTERESLVAVDTARPLTDESMKVSARDGAEGTLHLELIGKAGIADPVGEYVGMFMARGGTLGGLRAALEGFVEDPESADRWYEDAIGRSAREGMPWVLWPTPDSRWVEIDDERDHAAAHRTLAG